MGNTADWSAVNGNMTLGLRAMSMATISTLLNSCTLIAAMAIMNGNKPDDIFQVGVPDSSALLSGQELSPAKQKEIMECDQYNPMERATYQPDLKIMAIRDTNPKMSTGTGATLTLTIASGVITAGAITSSSTDFAGTIPGILVADIGGGQGAIIRPVITGGSVSSLTVVSGGYGYSTNSTATVLTNLSAGEKYQRPVFKWTQMKSTGRVYEHDHDRARALAAGNEDYFNQKINDIYMDDSKEKIGLQVQRMEEDMIFGKPTTSTDNLWDSPYGITYAIDDGSVNAVYAGVDRTLAANSYFRAVVDSSAHVFTLVDLWQDAHINKGRINNGGTIDVFFVSGTLFNKWMKESLAYQMNVNIDPMVQMLRATFGYKMPVLKFSNSYVMLEPRIPPKSVFGMNLKSWIIAFKQGKKWSIEGPFPQNAVEGGIDGNIYYVNTQYMAICEAPNYGQVQYNNVT